MSDAETAEPKDLEAVLNTLHSAADGNHDGAAVTVENILDAFGQRSFGPLLLVPGLIGISPIAAIPGVPAFLGVIEALIAGQILIGLTHFWLPRALTARSVTAGRLRKSVNALRPYAHRVDNLLRPRLTVLTRGTAAYVVAFFCLVLAIIMPVIALVPFAGMVPNAAIAAFGLALTAQDGVLAILATLFMLGSFAMILNIF